MGSLANVGSFIVALPPSDIWLTDEQAAEFLNYSIVYFKSHLICLNGFPPPKYIMSNSKGRRWNLGAISKWLDGRPETTKKIDGRPRKI